ncbi:MAG: acetoin utilization protein AcuC [Candidatus Thorarchaeota archaeon]|nr:acetoin utilization protein AcuC [Candidatus Thorarchaeota archaeon]
MDARFAYPYTEDLLQYEFRKSHPLKPRRLKLTYLLSKEFGLLDGVNVFTPRLATRHELELFHAPDFVQAVKSCETGDCTNWKYGLGTSDNPVFPKIYEAACRYVGATLDAMREVMNGAPGGFAISGGLHHAQRSEASGFCIFNDIAIAINLFQKKFPGRKVLYYDFDAHHADGVQNAFYRSKDVLTISIHETGRTLFPGTGRVYESGAGEAVGYAVNIPLLAGSGDRELITSFEEIVVPLFDSFEPDLLVTQLGVDGHYLDPLAHLAYTSRGYETVLTRLHELASEHCENGWLAVGGGGYHLMNVARLWTLFLAIMLDEDIPRWIPEDLLESTDEDDLRQCPLTVRDEEDVTQIYRPASEVQEHLNKIITRIKEEVFPKHGL